MSKYSLATFVSETKENPQERDYFELEKPQLLEINLNNQFVWTKAGSMIGYTGNINFERQGMFSGGLGNLLKKVVSGEGSKLMKAEGTGKLYVADSGKKVRILYLNNESICVNGNDVLAHDQSIKSDITMLKSIAGMMSGGLFQVKLSGTGHIAITTHGDPLTLMVTPDSPVYTDPNATVAWSGNLSPELKTNISFKSIMGRGSGEEFQMKFSGHGWVLIQPYEEVYTIEK
ncbi:AIM24 family protein [Chryseobacterium nematophagum]|uniref:AIM24 family protein n=1 Tax=Chryseobacterium nematophagum TaxID=2305228 RepID=A0A3M7LC43_9FLAO|nr:AIM24 family protein [Chryseobacterium nematophagum]RMZ59645.1 AIM24 family protein [Chryseobacterium nematophagum]